MEEGQRHCDTGLQPCTLPRLGLQQCPVHPVQGSEGRVCSTIYLHGHTHHLPTHTCRAKQPWREPHSGELCDVLCDVLCQPASSTILALRRVMKLELLLLEGWPTWRHIVFYLCSFLTDKCNHHSLVLVLFNYMWDVVHGWGFSCFPVGMQDNFFLCSQLKSKESILVVFWKIRLSPQAMAPIKDMMW